MILFYLCFSIIHFLTHYIKTNLNDKIKNEYNKRKKIKKK